MRTVLLSETAHARFDGRIGEILGPDHRCVHLDAQPAPDGNHAVDIALLTRDITGTATKFKPSPAMERFFQVLERSPRLRWVQTHSAGTDRPVWAPVRARGIPILTGAGAMSGTVAISAVGGIVALARRFPDLMAAQRRHAWLDVFAHEPLDPASPLWDLPRVMVSPHTSSRSDGNYDRVGEIFLDNLARDRDGRALRNDSREQLE